MRGGVSLQAVRARVERLAADIPDSDALTVFCWQMAGDTCVACGVDLSAHATAQAVERAQVTGARWVWAEMNIAVCPGCRIANPTEAAERSGAADAC